MLKGKYYIYMFFIADIAFQTYNLNFVVFNNADKTLFVLRIRWMEIESDNLNKAHIVRDFVLCVKKNPLFTKLTAYVLAYFGGDSFPQN